MLVTDLISFF